MEKGAFGNSELSEQQEMIYDDREEFDRYFELLKIDMPDWLKTRSDKMQSYWNEQSEAIGGNALAATIKMFSTVGSKDGGFEPSFFEKYFDSEGIPNENMFGDNSPLRVYIDSSQRSEHWTCEDGGIISVRSYFDGLRMKFMMNNREKFSEGKQWIFSTLDNIDFDSTEFEKKYSDLFSMLSNGHAWANSGERDDYNVAPQKFWDDALLIARSWMCDETPLIPGAKGQFNAREWNFLQLDHKTKDAFLNSQHFIVNPRGMIFDFFDTNGKPSDIFWYLKEFGDDEYRKLSENFHFDYSPSELKFMELPAELQEMLSYDYNDSNYSQKRILRLLEKYPESKGDFISLSLNNPSLFHDFTQYNIPDYEDYLSNDELIFVDNIIEQSGGFELYEKISKMEDVSRYTTLATADYTFFITDKIDQIVDNGEISGEGLLKLVIGKPEHESAFINYVNGFKKNEDYDTYVELYAPCENYKNYLNLPEEYRRIISDDYQRTIREPWYNPHGSDSEDYISNAVEKWSACGDEKDNKSSISFKSATLTNLVWKTGNFNLLVDKPIPNFDVFHDAGIWLSDKLLKILSIYKDIHDRYRSGADSFKDYINSHSLEAIDEDNLSLFPTLIKRVEDSNASEIRNAARNIVPKLIGAENPTEALEKIENVFLTNNLPYVGKVFKTFQILHPAENYKRDPELNGGYTKPFSRGVLGKAPKGGFLGSESILFNDILKASVGSNNRSLRQYISDLQGGQEISEQVLNGSSSFDTLSGEDKAVLLNYVSHLKMLYLNTEKGREHGYSPKSVEEDLTFLSSELSHRDLNVIDSAIRNFTGFLDKNSFDPSTTRFASIRGAEDLLAVMDRARDNADKRNRERAKNGDFSIRFGDLIKTIDENYLEKILQNGSVSQEFLNGDGQSDLTPLDTDVTVILDNVDGSISNGIDWKNNSAGINYGNTYLVLKGNSKERQRFQVTEDPTKSPIPADENFLFDPTRYELLHNRDSNFGIRGGFPSSEIDFIVSDSSSYIDEESYESRLKLNVAMNGFYIPIIDKESGELILTPDEYDHIREKMSGLSYYGTGEYNFASESDLNIQEIESIYDAISDNDNNTEKKREQIYSRIRQIFQESSNEDINILSIKNEIDRDLTAGSVELVDTGSTGRGTNIPDSLGSGTADFDFIMRLDRADYIDSRKKYAIIDNIRDNLSFEEDNSNMNGLRLKGVTIDGINDPVDIDISFTMKTNRLEYSTDMAISDRLKQMRRQNPKLADLAISNIIYAKQVLKEAGAYKPRHSNDEGPKGGLGGVGIENWVLQHGGSFVKAARDFTDTARMVAAETSAELYQKTNDVDPSILEEKVFEKFKQKYQIWDFGQNHYTAKNNEFSSANEYMYDNFVARNMDSRGFAKMNAALISFLGSH